MNPGIHTLSLSGDAAFRVWQSPNPGTNDVPLLVSGQTVTNGINGISWGTSSTADLYIQAVNGGSGILTYTFTGTGSADGIVSRASLKMTAVAPDLDVDANYDGLINEDDEPVEMSPGGIVLFNCDDDFDNLTAPDVDCDDAIVNGMEDAEDLTKLLLNTVPVLPEGGKLVLEVSEEDAGRIRVFSSGEAGATMVLGKSGSTVLTRYEYEPPFTAHVSGVEATCFADADYNGTTIVTQKIERADGTIFASDSVKLRVAPFLLSDSTQPLETVYVSNADTNFVAQLKAAVGADKVVEVSAPAYDYDVWVQDEVEIGYMQTPSGETMPVALDLPRSPTKPPERGLEVWPQEELRGTNFGYFAKGSLRDSPNFGGNLECTPPHVRDGVEYPFGRALVSTNMEPELVSFIEAQGVQSPVIKLDMSWLDVGHVDEIFAFIPSGDGFKVLVADTQSALSLLVEMNLEANGFASGGSVTTLADTNALWTSGQWADGIVRIVSGTGSNQVRQVVESTSDTLTVAHPWTVAPGRDSEYQVIARSAYRCLFVEGDEDVGVAFSITINSLTDPTKSWTPNCWAGGAVAIVTGDWQHHYAIQGNSANTLYLEDTWDTAYLPTDSSVYVIVTEPKVGASDPSFPQGRPRSQTVRQFLEHCKGNGVNVIYNENCQTNIDIAASILKGELGLNSDDFIRIPSLFDKGGKNNKARSFIPNTINLLVDGTRLVTAKPFGPLKMEFVLSRLMSEVNYLVFRSLSLTLGKHTILGKVAFTAELTPDELYSKHLNERKSK